MFYIMPKETYSQFTQNHLVPPTHWFELPDGTIFVKPAFSHLSRQDEVEAHKDVIMLPHPMSSEPVGDEIASRLAHLGVKKDHRTYDVAKLAARIHPMMRLR